MARFYFHYEVRRAPYGANGEDLWAVLKIGNYTDQCHGGGTIKTYVVQENMSHDEAVALAAHLNRPD